MCASRILPGDVAYEMQFESPLVAASHGYILKAHMNNRTLLNDVMWGEPYMYDRSYHPINRCIISLQ